MARSQREPQDRRKSKRDANLNVLRFSSLLGWLCLISGLLVLAAAKPESLGYFDRVNEIQRRLYWKKDLLPYALNLFVAGFGFSLAGLVFNATRLKRQGDFIFISVILLGALCLAAIVGYLLAFVA